MKKSCPGVALITLCNFVVNSMRRFKLSRLLSLYFAVLSALRSPRLGERELVCVLLVRLFVLRVSVCVSFLFLSVPGIGCVLCLWHSLAFSVVLSLFPLKRKTLLQSELMCSDGKRLSMHERKYKVKEAACLLKNCRYLPGESRPLIILYGLSLTHVFVDMVILLEYELTLALLNKLPRPFLIFSQSDYLIQIVDTNSHT